MSQQFKRKSQSKEFWALAILVGLILLFYGPAIFLRGFFYENVIRLVLIPWRSYVARSILHGQFPLWTDLICSGYPLGVDYATGLYYPVNLLFFLLFSPPVAMNYYIVFHFLLASVGMYFYARIMNISIMGSMMSSVIFTYSGYMVCQLCQPVTIDMASWFPIILILLECYFRKRKLLYIGFAGLLMGFCIAGSHPQITLNIFFFSIIYFLFRQSEFCLRNMDFLKTSFYPLVIFITTAIGLSALFTIPFAELLTQSYRGQGLGYEDEAFGSLPWTHLIRFLFPFIMGGPYPPGALNESGLSFSETCGYLGILPILFTGLWMASIKKSAYSKFYFYTGLVALLLAIGKYSPFFLVLRHIPLLNLYKAQGRYLLFVDFSFAIVSGFMFDEICHPLKKCFSPYFRILFFEMCLIVPFVLGILLLMIMIHFYNLVNLLKSFDVRSITIMSRKMDSYYHGLLLIISCFWLVLWGYKKISLFIFKYGILIILIIDLGIYSAALRLDLNKLYTRQSVRKIPPVVDYLKKDPGLFRIYTYSNKLLENPNDYASSLSILYRSFSMNYGIGNFHSHTPTGLERYYEFMGPTELPWITMTTEQRKQELYKRLPMLAVANIQYILSAETLDDPRLLLKYHQDSYLYEVVGSQPRTFFVSNWVNVFNKNEALNVLLSDSFDSTIFVVTENSKDTAHFFTTAQIPIPLTINILSPSRIIINVNTPTDGIIVLNDTYYPGWKAYIDNNKVQIIRANYLFQAVTVPFGKHHVEFIYQPLSFSIGFGITLVTFFCIIIWLIFQWNYTQGHRGIGDRSKKIFEILILAILVIATLATIGMVFFEFKNNSKLETIPIFNKSALDYSKIYSSQTNNEANHIFSVLNDYRKACLSSNASLFMSTFSPNYPTLLDKNKEITDFIEKYKYITFDYEIPPEHAWRIEDNRAEIYVKWIILLRQRDNNKLIPATETNCFHFENIAGKWKIVGVQIL